MLNHCIFKNSFNINIIIMIKLIRSKNIKDKIDLNKIKMIELVKLTSKADD